MSFDYERIKSSSESHGESHWISYSDLFTTLSVIFLLLYVTASLRSGSMGAHNGREYQRLAREAADLRQQIKVYNTLREDYLQTQASAEEQAVYEQLMSKLSLLRDEAREEKEELRQKAKDNEEKEVALNKYQQLVKSIINTNLLAKQQIVHRDELITSKEAQAQDRIAALRDAAAREASGLREQNHQAQRELDHARGALTQAKQTANRAVATAEELARDKEALTGDLQQARETANAKRDLVKKLRVNLSKAGIKANVDDKTGEVTLSFGDDYFTTGKAELTPTMKATLRRLMPAYSASLFGDPKVSEKLANVEIVGYASSTFQKKYVNPQSLRPEDQEAINYNLKLSFSRANAIFKYVFNTKELSFENQKRLLPMVKVVGRGYLPAGHAPNDIPAGLPEEEFCQRYNCEKAQRVIIKFNLKD